jgi:hypothetical protein
MSLLGLVSPCPLTWLLGSLLSLFPLLPGPAPSLQSLTQILHVTADGVGLGSQHGVGEGQALEPVETGLGGVEDCPRCLGVGTCDPVHFERAVSCRHLLSAM